jgi:hypothetical protein
MNSFNLYDYYKLLNKDDLTLAYLGNFNDSITDKVIDLAEIFLETHNLGKLKRRASFLVAECFQNITRHGVVKGQEDIFTLRKKGFFIRIQNNLCYISSANLVSDNEIPLLKQKIEHVNGLDKPALDSLHKIVLEEGTLSEKGGAGLGLIEMARKTGQKLYYSFDALSDNHSFFYLMILLGQQNQNSDNEKENYMLSDIKELHHQLTILNQYILFKCDFSQEVILPVIQMIEKNIDTESDHFSTKRNLYHATVEILQNVSNHALMENNTRTGAFSFGKNKEGFLITSINTVDLAGKLKLENHLDALEGNTKEELKHKYRKQIKTIITETSPSSGLGFIDLSRISKKWNYNFSPIDKGRFLFTYQVTI